MHQPDANLVLANVLVSPCRIKDLTIASYKRINSRGTWKGANFDDEELAKLAQNMIICR